MKRTQVYLTEEQDRKLARLAAERGTSRAAALRWALDTALGSGDAEEEARRVIRSTAGILADYPDPEEWQRTVRGATAGARLAAEGR